MEREMNINGRLYIIDEVEEIDRRIGTLTGLEAVMDIVEEFVTMEENTIFYFDNDMKMLDAVGRETRFAFLDTGLLYRGEALFLSLIYRENEYFAGHFIGNVNAISNFWKIKNPYNQRVIDFNMKAFTRKYDKKIEKRARQHLDMKMLKQDYGKEERPIMAHDLTFEQAKQSAAEFRTAVVPAAASRKQTPVTAAIYDQLLFPNWNSIDGLDRYLKVIGRRLAQLVKQGKDEYYVLNHIKSAVVNTGLMDQFGSDILVIYRYNMTNEVYEAYKVIKKKTDYLEHEFTREQVFKELAPISFFDEGEEVFQPYLEDFDLNQQCLIHIIENRRERFPANIRSMEAHVLAEKLRTALERGVRMQQRDRTFAKASYSAKYGCVSWFLPLHINRKLTESPELVMAIRKEGGFYELKTVMPYDEDRQDKFTALALYGKLW